MIDNCDLPLDGTIRENYFLARVNAGPIAKSVGTRVCYPCPLNRNDLRFATWL